MSIFRDQAIRNTHPTVQMIWEGIRAIDHDGNPITIDETRVTLEINRLQSEYDAKKYQRDRAAAYPSIQEQLDLLWHAMDEGSIPGNKTAWYTAIQSVKIQFPKS